jgi:hypothetical protein
VRLCDTWIFDGTDWKQADVAPRPNNGGVFLYDFRSQKIRMFGGYASRRDSTFQGMLWDAGWHTGQGMVLPVYNPTYAQGENEAIIFGGWNGKQRLNSVWVLTNQVFLKAGKDPIPAPRNHAMLVYDKRKEGYLLFAGHNGEEILNDVWWYKNDTWNCLVPLQPRKRVENNH